MALALTRWVGRAIGLDVHRDFCVVAICEDGRVRSAGRVPSTPEGLGVLAESLLPTDRVALEVTGSCWEVELTAGAPARSKQAAGIWSTNRAILHAERALAEQAEVSYQRMVTDQQAGRPSRKVGASATPERA